MQCLQTLHLRLTNNEISILPIRMAQTHQELWANCLRFIKDSIGEEQYNAWFRDITCLRFENGVLHLFVPSDMFVDYIEDKYLNVLGAAIYKEFGKNVRLNYAYNVKADDPSSMVDLASARKSPAISSQETATPEVNPFLPKPVTNDIKTQLNARYTFENYCCSASNKIAYNIAEAIANNPNIKTFNPFFIFGPTGVGKTHLIQAIGIRIKEHNPQARVLYVTSREFERQFTTALREKDVNGQAKNDINKFFNFYQSIDTLIVDDIQDLQNKGKTQNTFYNIFNHLHLNNKQIILSSDRSPAEMIGFEDRLLGRFKWGATVAMEKPDLDLRRDVLRLKAEQEGVSLSDDVLDYIVTNVTDSIRELEGVMASLLLHATVTNVPISLQLAQKVVGNAVKVTQRKLNFEMIAQEVSTYYGLDADALFTKSRKREVSDARQMAMYLAKKLVNMPLTTIGHHVSRSHATVIYAINNIEQRLAVEHQLQTDVSKIKAALSC